MNAASLTTPGLLCLIGAGEHARVVAETARLAGWEIAGCWAESALPGLTLLGDDAQAFARLSEWRHAHFHLALSGNPGGELRRRVAARWSATTVHWATIVHPSAVVSPHANLAQGVFVGPLAVINHSAHLGQHVLVNSQVVVEHDVTIGEGTHLAPASVCGGGARIGPWSFIGMGAMVRDHLTVGECSVVGMGSVVVHPVADGQTVVGSPARPRMHANTSESSGARADAGMLPEIHHYETGTSRTGKP